MTDTTAKIRELLPKTIEELENFTLRKSKEALALLDAERPSEWISVEKRLPEIDYTKPAYAQCANVLVHWDSDGVAEMSYRTNAYAKTEKGRAPRWEWMGRLSPWEITHWMPLPLPPDVKE